MPSHNDQYVLFTNLEHVIIQGIRASVSALLLEKDQHRTDIRAFGPDPAWTVFDMSVSSMKYILIPIEPSEGALERYPGAKLLIPGVPEIILYTNDRNHPVDTTFFGGDIEPVWDALNDKVRRYWRWPGFPRLEWGPTPRSESAISDEPPGPVGSLWPKDLMICRNCGGNLLEGGEHLASPYSFQPGKEIYVCKKKS